MFAIKYVAEYSKKAVSKMVEIKSNKRGIWTTEFIVAIIGAVIPILNTQLSWNIPTAEVISILTMLLGYIFNRMRLKEKSVV